MVRVPLRVEPLVFPTTVNVTVPFPVPPEVTDVIHGTLLDAIHEHPAPAVTVIAGFAGPPSLPMDSLMGLINGAHPEPWATGNECPAMVMLPDLPGVLLESTVYRTV